jgi:hypothetical protein
MQTHKHSVIESIVNVAVGFLISWSVWVWVVVPVFSIPYHGGQGLAVTSIFTVTSLIRSYALRRIFNCWHKEHA